MRLALVQMDIAWEDVAENHRRAARHLAAAKEGGAALAVLPEMFSTGFSMDAARIAQPPGGPSEAFLREEAARLGLWVLASVPEAGEPSAAEHGDARVAVGRRGAIREDPPVFVRRGAPRLRGRRARRDRGGRGRARHAVRLLRPALSRAVPDGGGGYGSLPRHRELAGSAPRALADAPARAGDREPGVRRGRQPGR